MRPSHFLPAAQPSTVGRPLYERFLRCARDRQDSAARSLALELARGDGLTELWASLYANRTARLGAVFARNGSASGPVTRSTFTVVAGAACGE